MSGARFVHIDTQKLTALLEDRVMAGGYYNWHRAFGGDIMFVDEALPRLGQYDIAFVPITGYNLQARIISRIRETIGQHIKIVTCVDYAWQIWVTHIPAQLYDLRSELLQADMVFSSTPAGLPYLQALSNKLQPVFIPHPINVRALEQFAVKHQQRTGDVMIFLHRYDVDWITPWLALKAEGYPMSILPAMVPEESQTVLTPYFPYREQYTVFSDFLPRLARKFVVLDTQNLMSTCGRLQGECACLGVPVVGSKMVAAQTDLWPELTTEPGDAMEQRRLIRRLYDSRGFYRDVTEYALNAVREKYSYEACAAQVLQALDKKGLTDEVEVQRSPAGVS